MISCHSMRAAMITLWGFASLFLLLNQLLGCHANSLAVSLVKQTIVRVESFGAKGDGRSDDTKAFQDAWKTVCSSSTPAILLVSQKSYRLKPITFSGPCRSNITFMVLGTILASPNRFDWDPKNMRVWLVFTYVHNLTVTGGGTINGNGNVWWQVSCRINKSLPCTDAPTALIFNNCKNLTVEKLKIINSPSTHVTFDRSQNVVASRITISSPSWAFNTDGVHITGTAITISGFSIQSGDDCIAILSGAHNVRIQGVVCGPGNGISIGSLGGNGFTGRVSNVIVDKIYFNGTKNGVRVKTWQGGNGYAKNIVFKNIAMHNVRNPIIIDQFYSCRSPASCAVQKSAVAISNIHYNNIKGTSASPVAITFNCSASVPCQGIELKDVNLQGKNGMITKSTCQNVNWSKEGLVLPPPCQSA